MSSDVTHAIFNCFAYHIKISLPIIQRPLHRRSACVQLHRAFALSPFIIWSQIGFHADLLSRWRSFPSLSITSRLKLGIQLKAET